MKVLANRKISVFIFTKKSRKKRNSILSNSNCLFTFNNYTISVCIILFLLIFYFNEYVFD